MLITHKNNLIYIYQRQKSQFEMVPVEKANSQIKGKLAGPKFISSSFGTVGSVLGDFDSKDSVTQNCPTASQHEHKTGLRALSLPVPHKSHNLALLCQTAERTK